MKPCEAIAFIVMPDIDVQPSLLRLPCDDMPGRGVDDGAADVLRHIRGDPGIERTERPDVPAGRNVLDRLAIDDPLPGGVLDVDRGSFAGHRDRFLERADAKVAIDGGGEVAGQLDAVTLERIEARPA